MHNIFGCFHKFVYICRMIQIEVRSFIGHSYELKVGSNKMLDSKVIDLSFIKDDQQYDVKARLEIEYNRWIYPETRETPMEDEVDVKFFDIELIKGHNDHKELSEKDLRRLRQYIIDNIEFI